MMSLKTFCAVLISLIVTSAQAANDRKRHFFIKVPDQQILVEVGGPRTSVTLFCPPSGLYPRGISFSTNSAKPSLMVLQQTPTSVLTVTAANGQWVPIAPQWNLALDNTCSIFANSNSEAVWGNVSSNYKATGGWQTNTGHGNQVVLTPGLSATGIYTITRMGPRSLGVGTQAIYILRDNNSNRPAVYIVPPTYQQTIPSTFNRVFLISRRSARQPSTGKMRQRRQQ
jgi:hypothetical protein